MEDTDNADNDPFDDIWGSSSNDEGSTSGPFPDIDIDDYIPTLVYGFVKLDEVPNQFAEEEAMAVKKVGKWAGLRRGTGPVKIKGRTETKEFSEIQDPDSLQTDAGFLKKTSKCKPS